MSFRSRSRTIQPVVQRRSLSGSRLPSCTVSSYSNSRPLSLAYTPTYSSQNYTSPYTSSSRDNIYNSLPLTRSNSYYSGGSSSSSSTNNSGRRDSYGSTIYKNPYSSERYVSPYTTYDNGITTAGLSIKSSYGSGTNTGYGGKSSYTSAYTNKPSNRHSSNLVSTSNSSLNSYTSSLPSTSSTSNLSSISRSQSFKDQEHNHKSRNVRRHSSLKSTRSLSVSSEKSEGYEVSKRLKDNCDKYIEWFCFLSVSSIRLHFAKQKMTNLQNAPKQQCLSRFEF